MIAGNDDARQVEIYIPSKTLEEMSISSTGETKITKNYTKSRKKAKEVKFSDFRKNDKILSVFDDLEEPYIPQKICPINDAHDLLKVRID